LIFDFSFFPKALATARGKNEGGGCLLTKLVICNVHCLALFLFFQTTWTAPEIILFPLDSTLEPNWAKIKQIIWVL
jgi:hypothetical protein